MKIKDIVNHSNVNLQNCDQEPIHIPGSIQPHGFLIGVETQSMNVKFCSGNAHEYSGATHEQLLGKKISELLSPASFTKLKEAEASLYQRVSVLPLELLGTVYDFIAHASGAYIILEAEKGHAEAKTTDLIELSKDFVSSMEETQTLKELCNLVAVSIKKITGYDRVMVYRFDEQYNGEVFSESKNEELESFLGLHYPHTDIPVQARALYIKNQLRIITDTAYSPVPVYTIGEAGSQDLDLSLSVLRSVSPIHIQYLQNMGVGATLTISLLLRNKLWGLIACHHYSEKYLSYDVRMSAKLLGHFITSQIDSRLLNEEYEIAMKANNAVKSLSSQNFELNRQSLQEIVNAPSLLAVCNATAVGIVFNDKVYKSAQAPSDKNILLVAEHFATLKETALSTDSVFKSIQSVMFDKGMLPGISYHKLPGGPHNCIIWFRQENIHEVNWAGDPAKAIEKDKNGLSPRKSFESWSEIVKERSKPWLQSELQASLNFTGILEKHLNSILLSEEEEKQREMANALKKTNAELENINWISTHDLQEPLRKIQIMASILLEDEKQQFNEEVQHKIGRMNDSARRMQGLIKDILKYTRLNYNSEAVEPTDLNELLNSLVTEFTETLKENNTEITIGNLPVINSIPFLIRQLFTNLINNSLKFRIPEKEGQISFQQVQTVPALPENMTRPLSDYFIIEYRDNGIGFYSGHNEDIFKIFTRLHSAEKYAGSGVGLALCRKIMSTHKGFITAEGKKGEGAVFRLFFLKNSG